MIPDELDSDDDAVGTAPRTRRTLGAIALLVLPIALCALSGVRIIDDAYISFRYADRLAAGKGFTFNDSERVEGVSNLAWTSLLALSARMGLPMAASAAALGICAALGAFVVTASTCIRLRLGTWAVTTSLVWLAALPAFWLTVANGLEGGVFALLLSGALRNRLLEGHPWFTGLLGGAMFLVRPESVLLLAVFAVGGRRAVDEGSVAARSRARDSLVMVGSWLAVVAATTLWRLAYFDAWLPNTIAAKSPPSWSFDLVRSHAAACLSYYGGFFALAAPLTFGILLAPIVARTHGPRLRLLLGVLVVPALAIFVNGGDWMPRFRLLTVYAPAVAILTAMALDRVPPFRATPGGRSRGATALATLLLLGGIAIGLRGFRLQPGPSFSVQTAEPCWQELAEAVAPAVERGDLLAPETLGLFGYRLRQARMFDLFGLTDRHRADSGRRFVPQYGTTDPSYMLASRPTLIVVHSGLYYLSPLARLPGGEFDAAYLSLTLESMPAACTDREWIVSVRRDAVARFEPALSRFAPRRIAIPTR